ncbi:MAG: prolipoprotein diacylglyceryl transferase [Coriobacteriales bacterium]|jgi:phosphatidylglycerol:prolipoprotein diacylglycerol transferase|nr:prolipoprotein diacylglyceryl transferase [Coriobacteriales bacterium]
MFNDIYHALDPVAFFLGPFAVRWYGLGYIFGIAIGAFIALRVARRWQIRFSRDALLTLLLASTLGIIVGARLGYALFYGAGFYLQNPEQLFLLNNGGMSFHGGLLGMVIAAWITARLLKMPLATLCDLIVIAAPAGIFLVRCANFVNGELWGAITDVPWGVVFDGAGDLPRHPTQLYEAALEGLLMLIILLVLAWRRPPLPRGSYLGLFLLLYGVFRCAVEFVRQPDAHIGYLAGGWVTMGMVLSLPLVVIGGGILVYSLKAQRPQQGQLA